MKRALIINRIPKTGSTYLATSLRTALSNEKIELSPLNHWPHKSLYEYQESLKKLLNSKSKNLYIQGHLPLGSLEEELKTHGYTTKTIIVVRNPEERFRSHLSYFLSCRALVEDNLGLPRYISHPLMSLQDIFVDHQYRWLTGFYSGWADICSPSGSKCLPPGLLARLHSSSSSMNEFIKNDQSNCLLVPSDIFSVDKLLNQILNSIDIESTLTERSDDKRIISNNTPQQAVLASLSLIKASQSCDLNEAKHALAAVGCNFTERAVNELMKVITLAMRPKSYDSIIYNCVVDFANSSSLGCYLSL